MASNLLGRYVWLVDTLRRHKRLTYNEINKLWQQSGLSYGEGDELPLRTFHNHRAAIKDIFDIYIECDKKDGNKYYIDDPERLEGDGFRSWLIDSYATLNQIQADRQMEGRILFEDIPSGHRWLMPMADAMRHGHVVSITHRGFGKPEATTFLIEPYCLKVVARRWYVVARSPYYSERNRASGRGPRNVYLVYALDRIEDLYETDGAFKPDASFDADRFFEGYCGVNLTGEPVERVVIKARGGYADYLRTLPLHSSQRELGPDGDDTLFECRLRATFDFYQLLLSNCSQIEVVEPEHVRSRMLAMARDIVALYGGDGGNGKEAEE